MSQLRFEVVGHGPVTVQVKRTLNGGYAGRNTAQVQHHIDELAALGVPGPSRVPTLYPLAASLAVQPGHLIDGTVQVPHGRTSGEAEWAMIVPDSGAVEEILVTAACDHTDRALEVHGVAWSKQSAPDVLGDVAWRWSDVADSFDDFALRAWVGGNGESEGEPIQDGTAGELLAPSYWIEKLAEADLLLPGTVLMSGTIAMTEGVDQFADSWRVELSDAAGNVSQLTYAVEVLPEPWD